MHQTFFKLPEKSNLNLVGTKDEFGSMVSKFDDLRRSHNLTLRFKTLRNITQIKLNSSIQTIILYYLAKHLTYNMKHLTTFPSSEAVAK